MDLRKLSLPRFDKIKDFSAIQNQLYSFSAKQKPGKIQLQNTTETSDKESQSKIIRSLKARNKVPEVSFAKDSMQQHIEAFEYKLEKYLSQMFENTFINSKPLLSQQIFPAKSVQYDDTCPLQACLKSPDSLLEPKQSEMFMEDLYYEQKLQLFLKHICTNSCDQVSLELIYLSNKVREQYQEIEGQEYSYQKLIESAKNLVEYFIQIQKNSKPFKYITLEETFLKPTIQQDKKQEKIKEIVQFFVVTIFLLLSQYFANPYYQEKRQNQLKRHNFFNNYTYYDSNQGFSEGQDSQEFQSFNKGRKKGKLSFD